MINGKIVPIEEALIRIQDLGLLRGYGIFDFFPIMKGRLVFINDYYDRFYSSAKKMQLVPPLSRADLSNDIYSLIGKNGEEDGYIRLVLTGGDAPDGFSPQRNNLYILQYPAIHNNSAIYEKGVKLTLQKFQRERPDVKTLNYANALRHRKLIEDLGAIDVLYHDGRNVHETSRANFFIVDKRGIIHTTADTVLSGITRSHLIQVAAEHYPILELSLTLADLLEAEEAFLTSTTKGVLPVTKIDNLAIGSGIPGPVTQHLSKLFDRYVEEHVRSALELKSP